MTDTATTNRPKGRIGRPPRQLDLTTVTNMARQGMSNSEIRTALASLHQHGPECCGRSLASARRSSMHAQAAPMTF
jgi:hypothetical protein